MRTLSASLTSNQKKGGKYLEKIVLTLAGEATQTYGIETTDPLDRQIQHSETPYSQNAEVFINNASGNLTSLDLSGYKGVISRGYNDPTQGDEYSPCAPLWIIAQSDDSLPGQLIVQLSLAGTPNFLAKDKANAAYTPDSSNTDTIKTILTAIAQATLAPFNHCVAYTITYDSEDSLIDVFQPKDSFAVSAGENRLDKMKWLLGNTNCVMRVEDDEEIHIFVPTTTGTSYDYEYKFDVTDEHTFFRKSHRKRFLVPNYIVVESTPGHSPSYSGFAEDTDSSDIIEIRSRPHYRRLASNQQATDIATAIRDELKVDSELGSGFVPVNVGAEVYDYVKITDSRQGDTRVGNIGYLNRTFTPGKIPVLEFRFGSIALGGVMGILPPGVGSGGLTMAMLQPIFTVIYDALNDIITFIQESSTYLPLAGGTMTGNIAMGSNKVTGLAAPTSANDAVRKAYADLFLLLAGGTMSGAIAMGSNKITGLAAGSASGDALRYEQLISLYLLLTGGTLSGDLTLANGADILPENTGGANVGSSAKEVGEVHTDKLYASVRSKISVGTAMYD